MHYSSDNPVTVLLARRHTDWAAITLVAVGGLAFLLTCDLSQLLGLKISLVLAGSSYVLLRAACDSANLASWRQSRQLETMLLSPLTGLEVVDGLANFSLRRSLWAAGGVGLSALACAAASGDRELLWLGLVEPAFLLLGVFALLHLFLAGPGWWGLLALLFGLAAPSSGIGWPIPVLATLLSLGLGARQSAARNLLRKEDRNARVPIIVLREAVLWSENPIVVRELRRESRETGYPLFYRHGGFMLMGLLILVNLLTHGPLDAPRCQLNACAIVFALLFLQTLRTALTTTPAVVQERECGTLASLALSGLSVQEFVDGWAHWSLRPRLGENFLGLTVALSLAVWGGHLVALVPDDCTLYPRVPFQTVWGALLSLIPWCLATLTFTAAGAYLGLMSSADSPSHAEASGRTLLYLIVVGLTGLGLALFCSVYATAVLGLAVAVWARHSARHQLSL